MPQTSPERGLARQFVRRTSAVERGHPAPRTYRQKSHRYRAVAGTAQGTADLCLAFADTRMAHGVVPAVATTRPVRTARTMTGMRCQSASAVDTLSLLVVLQVPPNETRLVGMKRQLDLHGNVVASFCPTTEERAHRFATGRTPGGQPPYRYDRARSAQARESAVRADGGRGDRGAPDRHEPGAVHGGAREPRAGPHPRGGVDRERVGRPTLGELGARGDRGGPELRADVRHAPPRGEDRSAGCAHLGRGVPPRRLPTGAPRLGPPAPRAGAARGARRADPDAHPLRQRGEGAGAPGWTAAAARQSGAHGGEAGGAAAAGAAGPGTRAAARPLRAPQ